MWWSILVPPPHSCRLPYEFNRTNNSCVAHSGGIHQSGFTSVFVSIISHANESPGSRDVSQDGARRHHAADMATPGNVKFLR